MEIQHPEKLQTEVLLGIVNEKLRLHCEDQAALFYDLDMVPAELESRLNQLGYEYDPACNQYRPR